MPGRFHLAATTVVVSVAALTGCQGGTPRIFGYQLGAKALYDTNIKTVYVPMFNNRALQTTPFRGMEVELTKAVVREIGAKTPYRVVSDPERADTELRGVVVSITKNVLNRNQQNFSREDELAVVADVLWWDLHTGRNLSAPRPGVTPGTVPVGVGPLPEVVPFDPNVERPPVALPAQSLLPVRLVGTGRVLPELGESSTTGEQKAINALAVQIVSMMEKPW